MNKILKIAFVLILAILSTSLFAYSRERKNLEKLIGWKKCLVLDYHLESERLPDFLCERVYSMYADSIVCKSSRRSFFPDLEKRELSRHYHSGWFVECSPSDYRISRYDVPASYHIVALCREALSSLRERLYHAIS